MLIFMLATPVLLMLILGTVLSGNFNGSKAVDDIRVIYSANGIGDSAELDRLKQWFDNGTGEEVKLEETTLGEADALRAVENGTYSGYVSLGEDGIDYYGNSRTGVENGIIHGLLAAYAEHRKLNLVIPEGVSAEGSPIAGNHMKGRALQAPLKPDAIDYYAVAVTTMMIMYSAATAGLLFENERVRHTANRLLVAPVTKAEIFAGKILGSLWINSLFIIVIVLISKFMYGANWGNAGAMGMSLLVLLSQIVFAISLGLGASYLFKGKAAGAVVMTFIQLAAFFGGSYYQVEDNGDFVSLLARFSPLDWTNDAIIAIIYGGGAGSGLSAAAEAILLNVGFSVLFLAISILLMRRKEGL
jgi:ABC-2 type transport system permease protein